MSTPTGENAFLLELELSVRDDLTLAETGQSTAQAAGLPGGECLPDPDAQRYEVALRTLLGAIEALEDGSRPGDHPLQAGTPESVRTASQDSDPALERND